MGKRRISDEEVVRTIQRASTPEAREAQIVASAYDLAEERIRNGTASDTLLREFVKMGSPKEKIEREILERQKDLITAKIEALEAQRTADEVYSNALEAFKAYHGDSEDGSDVF